MHLTPAKLVEDRITVYTHSANSTRKLAFSCSVPAFSPLIIIFVFLSFTLNPSRLLGLVYIDYTILTNHFSTPSFLKFQHTASLGTRSKAFSKSTNAKCKFFGFGKCLTCNCFKIKMAFVVPHPGVKPNCILSMFTCCFINFSTIFSAVFSGILVDD